MDLKMGRIKFSILIFRRVKCIPGRGHPGNCEIKKKFHRNFKSTKLDKVTGLKPA